MAVLPPAPQRTVALTTGLHQRDATDQCRDANGVRTPSPPLVGQSWRAVCAAEGSWGAGHGHNWHDLSVPLSKVQNAQYLGLVSIVVRDYDEALAFCVGELGFSI